MNVMKFHLIYYKSLVLIVSKLYFLISLGLCNINYYSLPTPVRCQRRLGLHHCNNNTVTHMFVLCRLHKCSIYSIYYAIAHLPTLFYSICHLNYFNTYYR